jgi:hypothetical protein
MFNKEFYRSNKNGTHWQIYGRKMHNEPIKNKIKHIEFHPFPTLKFDYNKNNIMENSSFDIRFIWLLWEIRITRYWGEEYRKQMEMLKE